MQPVELIAQAAAPDGAIMKLTRRGDEFTIQADGHSLMSSRMHGSEEEMARLACAGARNSPRPRVLVGGLGMGFTLRAALDSLSGGATVVVAELLPAVVEWNRGPLAPLAARPLEDGRVRVEINDVAAVLAAAREQFDAVLLDVDNGPEALTGAGNAGLYTARGIRRARAALKAEGVLAVWSAREDRGFEQRLRSAGFAVRIKQVRGRLKDGGPRHTIYLAQKVVANVARRAVGSGS